MTNTKSIITRSAYSAPAVESVEFAVERGFAESLKGMSIGDGHYQSEEVWD